MTEAEPDPPYDRLRQLPRTLWRGPLVTSIGDRVHRLDHARRWLDALTAGRLPDPADDLGDALATAPMRAGIGNLELPALCRGTPALAEQVLRTMLWHLDAIAGMQPRHTRAEAIAEAAARFADEWQRERAGLEERLTLLQGLGDRSMLSWDALSGRQTERDWQAAQRASQWLQQLPTLAALIRRLGRSAPAADAPPRRCDEPTPALNAPAPMRAVSTRLPQASGELTGVRLTGRLEHMLASEAQMLRHPVLRKLWRARHAESRLLGHDTEAHLVDWRPDPEAALRQAVAEAPPRPLEAGPLIVCLDTSGSMRGAPENIAKAAVIAALRSAHAQRRRCLLIAFGAAGEIVESELGLDPSGLAAMLSLMGRAFDGGTDVQTPLQRAIERVRLAHWRQADVLLVSDGEFGCTPAALAALDEARAQLGLRVQGVLVGDRETLGLLEVCDDLHWVRDWRRYANAAQGGDAAGASPVHSKSLTALYFPGALSERARRLSQAGSPPSV